MPVAHSVDPVRRDLAVDTEALFRQYAGSVASFLVRLGARREDLPDLVQDVFVTAHRKGGYLPGAASPMTFLARLAIDARRELHRRNGRWLRARNEPLAVHGTGAPAPDQALSEHEAARELERILARMEPGARAVFVLFELDGESCESIAAGLDMKLGTVYSRLHAARKQFRKQLERSQNSHVTVPMRAARQAP